MTRTPQPDTPPDMAEEQRARSQGHTRVCGIDEAGRGPLAGPVVAAAVILPEGYELPGLNDSKKLTAKKREQLYSALMADERVQKCIAQATVQEIDELNILNATMLAMRRAVEGRPVKADAAAMDMDFASPLTTVFVGMENPLEQFPSIKAKSAFTGSPSTARRMASMVAFRMFSSSISAGVAQAMEYIVFS